MRSYLTSISILLFAATGCIAAPTESKAIEDLSTRAVSGSQLYGCTARNFGGHCETTPNGETGVCIPTTGMFRNNLISVRAVRYGAYLYQGDNCSGPRIYVDTEGWGNIGDTMYKSYYTPTPCLPPRCSVAI
ncbi:hypothetical protein RSOLAG1IB_02508 [Rhizoctonia solani AG-1 IB]|uniref:Uncharacterized protein n=1 Tax=Thanatephorus cucumeris (strain AG1-IB / isolate 7/3/14) TaxID=1108050 RepID=A0A0B7FLG7_THACB|nr:hypothetical protein RSOLAG1IB_02508 [Rhizoctonia solani AG-1 IB]